MTDSIPAVSAVPDLTRFPYLSGLNSVQRAAVEALDGPVLVLAGAGTGKTRVLTTRLAHLLFTRRAVPGQILTVTFTNKAAREMRERVSALVGVPTEGWWMGTFHALAARILRRHAELVGLTSSFTILDTDDQIRLLKQILSAENIDDKKWPARTILGVIERWKDKGLTPDRLKLEDVGEIADGRTLELYRQYQERLKSLNACDFGDLLLHNLTLFQKHLDVLADYHRRFRYILVDEYQDTNVAQYLWLRLLAQGHKNLCCVGDDDQSIYGWRGAEVGNILKFEHDFPGAQVIRLEENYRSTGHILAAASGVIAHNRGRLGKTLWTASDSGDKVQVRSVWDSEEEARWVAEEIESRQRKGISLGDMAVLVRAGFQTREFEERFITVGIPYRVIGGPRFYERQEIRDALAYLRTVTQPADDLAFERIINVPKRGIGDATIQQLYKTARTLGVPLFEATARLVETDELRPKVRGCLRDLVASFDRWRAALDTTSHTELTQTILDESGYTDMWKQDKSPEAPGRLENLKELVNAIGEFENLTGFLEHVSLVMEAAEGDSTEMVSLMTLHSAKGLEFDTVFLPGWEEGIFPSQRSLEESGIAGLEEERRLAYVGITRARIRAYIVHAARRMVRGLWTDGIPSRFIAELPTEHVEVESDIASYGGMSSGFGWHGGGQSSLFSRAPRSSGETPRRSPPMLEGVSYKVQTPARSGTYATGSRVFHQKFGYGTVRAVEADKLDIAFDKAGLKKVMASFVKPADQA